MKQTISLGIAGLLLILISCSKITLPNDQSRLLLINEIMTSNSALIADTSIIDNDGMHADFAEFYNAGAIAYPLHGLYITDDSLVFAAYQPGTNDTQVFALTDTIIPPGGFYVLWSGRGITDTTNHMIIHLSRKTTSSEKLVLFDSTKTIIAQINFSQIPDALITNKSYGRYPDGGTAWQQFTKPTPGFPNR